MKAKMSLVPAAVVSLKAHAGNQSETLCVSWDRGPGELSGYLLSLYNPNGSQQARMQLGSEANEVALSDLVPGRLYRAEVLSLSGELSNGASTLGRTGERPLPPPVCLCSGDQTKRNKRWIIVLCFLLSSQTFHFLPVQGSHQHLSRAHLEWPRQLRLRRLRPAVDTSRPPVRHQPLPKSHIRQPHPQRDVPWAIVHLQPLHCERGHGAEGLVHLQHSHSHPHPDQ